MAFGPDTVGHVAARQARDVLERASLGLQATPALPPGGLEEVTSRLLRAISALYVVRETGELSTAHLEGLGLAAAVASEVSVLLTRWAPIEVRPIVSTLRAAELALRDAFDAVARRQSERRDELDAGRLDDSLPEPRPLHASVGVPRLHSIARRPLVPQLAPRDDVTTFPAPEEAHVETPIELSEVADLKSLGARIKERVARAVAPPIVAERPEEGTLPWVGWEPAIEELEVLRRFGRDALEEIALSRTLRTPNELEKWTDIAPFEDRLLAQLDSFVSYGAPALGILPVFLFEGGDVDPDRAFAAALAMGSIEGADSVGALLFDLRQAGPDAAPGFVEGLALAPNPRIDGWMDDLARSPDPHLAEVALQVLARRGTTNAELALSLRSSEVRPVLALALRALGTSGERGSALAAIELALGHTSSAEVVWAGLDGLLTRRSPDAVVRLEQLARSAGEERGRALVWLAIAGRPEHDELLWRGFQEAPSEELARSLGRHGSVELIERMIGALDAYEGPVRLALVEGLELATGANLLHEIEEPWPVEIPEGVDATGIQLPTRRIVRSIEDPAAWRAFWKAHGQALRRTAGGSTGMRKLRRGVLFSPEQAVDEVAAPVRSARDREAALREARWATGAQTHVWLGDWVARQRDQLEALRQEVRSAGPPPGSWLVSAARAHAATGPHLPDVSAVHVVRPGSPADTATAVPSPPPIADAALESERKLPAIRPASGVAALPAVVDASLEGAQPKPVRPRPSAALEGTQPMPSVRRLSAEDALPFSQRSLPTPPSALKQTAVGAAPSLPAVPFVEAPASRGKEALDRTSAFVRPPGPALPFGAGAAKRASNLERTADVTEQRAPITPFDATAAGAGKAIARVSLAAYAAACAELACRPELAESIFARYGMADHGFRRAVDVSFKERFARDPALRKQFDEAFARARSVIG